MAGAFQSNAFQNNAFQVESEVCVPAFNRNAFQNNAFQVCEDTTPTTPDQSIGGGGGWKREPDRRPWEALRRAREEIREAIERALSGDEESREAAVDDIREAGNALLDIESGVSRSIGLDRVAGSVSRLGDLVSRDASADRIVEQQAALNALIEQFETVWLADIREQEELAIVFSILA